MAFKANKVEKAFQSYDAGQDYLLPAIEQHRIALNITVPNDTR